jgi:transcriptional regulator with XRE-family HTH domain
MTVSNEPTPAAARAKKGLSMRALADASGVSLRTVFRVEHSGKWPVHFDVRRRLRRALGMPR